MRFPLTGLLILMAAFVPGVVVRAQGLPGWTLVWADEFSQSDGAKPDPAKWGHDIGGSGWGNNELQYYTDRTENARIEGGNLVIEARAENYSGKNHTSARLLTKGKWSWTYGRIEARIRIPRGQGIWSAFWMLGANVDVVNWPACGEIDIMENIGSLPSTLYGTAHGPGYSGAGGVSGNTVLSGSELADDFHVYAIEWEENRIQWFLDGQPYFTVTPGSLPNGGSWAFNQPQFLLLNLAVGGNWPGPPNGSTVFPQRMTVDYVRVYSQEPSAPVETVVTVDPAESWLGYMHVFDLPSNGGARRSGQSWPVAGLRAVFNGPVLTLSPNTIGDPAAYWYIGGGGPGKPGNKIMKANMYVEETGGLSGKTVVFTGAVPANTLTGSHQSVAFIRDFSPDFSSFQSVTVPLTNGIFRLSLTTAAGAGRHVQYGFETTGVNVWPTDAGPFGSVSITAAPADPFAAWMAGFNFSGFVNPDLTEVGDPDGDGQDNRTEFALDGDPAAAASSGKIRVRVESIDGERVLLLTLPVRDGAVFSGSPALNAIIGQLCYRIAGSDDLAGFDRAVVEVSPARAEGMPATRSGWNYRSFRLAGSVDGPSPRGFLRAGITSAP
ncbi:MAG: glycoside hydrolase family 16 protein [Verrucomicrobiota bacterium]